MIISQETNQTALFEKEAAASSFKWMDFARTCLFPARKSSLWLIFDSLQSIYLQGFLFPECFNRSALAAAKGGRFERVDFGTGEQSGYGGDGISRRYAGITQSVGWLIRNQPIGNCIAVECVIVRQGAHSVDGEEGRRLLSTTGVPLIEIRQVCQG